MSQNTRPGHRIGATKEALPRYPLVAPRIRALRAEAALPVPALDVERLDDLVMEHSHHAPLLKGGWYVERKPLLDFLADLREGETK